MDTEKYILDLKRWMSAQGYTQRDIAERLSVSQPSVANLLNGKKPFGKLNAYRWQEAFGISASWLMTGEGEMLVGGKEPSVGGSHNTVTGDHNVVGSGVQVHAGAEGELQSLRQQNEALTRSLDRLTVSLDRLTRQMDLLMSDRLEVKQRHNDSG